MDLKMDLKVFRGYLIRKSFQKVLYVVDASHDIRGNGFCDLTVLKQISHGFAGEIVSLDLGDHGKMCTDVIPESIIGFQVQIDHFLNMEDLVGNIVSNIAKRLMLPAVVNSNDHIIIVPSPVFFPGKGVTDHTAVPLKGKVGMYIMIIFRIQTDTFYHTGNRPCLGKLYILYIEGKLVRADFPAHFPVEGNGVGAEKGEWHLLFVHIIKHPAHEGVDQASSGIFRIGCHTGDTAHVHNVVMDIDLHMVDNDHGSQPVLIEPADDIGLLQDGTLGIFDLILCPAGFKQFLGCDLESVLQQGIELIQISLVKLAHSKVTVCFQINRGFVLILHNNYPFLGLQLQTVPFYNRKKKPSMGFLALWHKMRSAS